MSSGNSPFEKPERNPFANDFEERNPYAPPSQTTYIPPPVDDQEMWGLWRSKKLLVMHKEARLPPFCVKSNEPATRWLDRKLQWYPKWVIVLLLINVLICAIVALILTKRATISIGLTEEWMQRRRQRLMISWLAGLTGVASVFLSFLFLAFAENNLRESIAIPIFLSLLLTGIIMALGGLIFGHYGCSMVTADKITDTHIWVRGVNGSFLDRLPDWSESA